MKQMKLFFRSCIFCTLYVFGSCVKDVDFNQAGDIYLTPEIQSDLLIYDLDKADFLDPDNKDVRQIIRDTVRLEFLDDDYIQNNLKSVEFYFRHTNSFPQAFSSRIHFLSNSGRRKISVDYIITPGSVENPSITDTIVLIEEDRINLVRSSIQMAVELEVQPNDQDFSGELDFASKGLFKFNF